MKQLWIIRCHSRYSHGLNILGTGILREVLASFLLFYTPIMLIGISLTLWTEYNPFTRGVTLGLLFVGIAPFVISWVEKHLLSFFKSNTDLYKDPVEMAEVEKDSLSRLSSTQYNLYGVIWAAVLAAMIVFTLHRNAPILIRGWSFCSFFITFYVSSIGFQGLIALGVLINRTSSSKINFRPWHPDSFGGLSSLGNISVKVCLAFSIGAICFPGAFEVIKSISSEGQLVEIASISLVLVFISSLMAGFLYPVLKTKQIVNLLKEAALKQEWELVQKDMDALISATSTDSATRLVEQTRLRYDIQIRELNDIKEYPWDTAVLIELFLSFILPLGISITEIYIK